MKKDLLIILGFIFFAVLVFRKSFFNFFTQDDFLLITQFSQHGFFKDLWNVFGPPQISHWRPIHNLYFLISGKLFYKNYFEYHILTFILHLITSFLIYKISYKFLKNTVSSFSAGLIYLIHPAFFISYFWISGGATVIGSFIFILGFYLYLNNKKEIALLLYFLSMLASEAMIMGGLIFIFYNFIFKKNNNKNNFLPKLILVGIIFSSIRFLLFNPKVISNDYQFEFNFKIISSLKYYLLQIFGFGDIKHGFFQTVFLLIWLLLLSFQLIKNKIDRKFILFWGVLVIGIFPFVLLPNHLSPHYMNISIFGFSLLVALGLSRLRVIATLFFIVTFLILSWVVVEKTYQNNWVIKRSNTSKLYIETIEKSNLPSGSTIIFNDNNISSSYDAYVSLGTGKALDFWFKDKNYKSCFWVFEICEAKP